MKRLVIIIHYQEIDPRGRSIVTNGRCLSYEGKSIPWFEIARKVFVAAVTSLCREVAVHESFPAREAA